MATAMGLDARVRGGRREVRRDGLPAEPGERGRTRGRQHAVHRRAAVGVVLGPQPPAVRGDDRARNRESQAEPLRLGGDERLEQPIDQGRRNAGPTVAYRQVHVPACRPRPSGTAADRSRPLTIIASQALRRRFSSTCCSCTRSPSNSEKSGSTTAVAVTRRAISSAWADPARRVDQLARVHRLQSRLTALEQRAEAMDHLRGALVVGR